MECKVIFQDNREYPFKLENIDKMLSWLQDKKNYDKVWMVQIGKVNLCPLAIEDKVLGEIMGLVGHKDE